jgi:hypothetical protein
MALRRFLALVALGILLSGTSLTLSVQSGFAQDVSGFLNDPQAWLKQYPSPNYTDPNDPMTQTVKALAIANPQTLYSLLSLIPNANKAEKQALGKGLSEAAAAVVASNPTYANDILQAITKTHDHDLVLAATNDTQTASTAGGGGGGGALGGQTNSTQTTPTQTGGPQGINGGSSPTNPFSVSSSVTGSGGISNPTTFSSVSP